MLINLKLQLAGEQPKVVTAKAPEFVALENKYNISVAALEKDVRYTYLCFFAWHAEKRTGATDLDFETWVEKVESLEAEPVKK